MAARGCGRIPAIESSGKRCKSGPSLAEVSVSLVEASENDEEVQVQGPMSLAEFRRLESSVHHRALWEAMELQEAADSCYFVQDFLAPTYIECLLEKLRALQPFSIPHEMTMANKTVKVTSRPKLVFGVGCKSGYGLYNWGQTVEFMQMVDEFPPFVHQLKRLIAKRCPADFPSIRCCNHCILTFSERIPWHHDKAHSTGSEKLTPWSPEDSTPIFLLSFGNSCRFELGHPKFDQVIRTIDFVSGSLIVMPGLANARVRHRVETVDREAGIRVSIVFRRVDRDFVKHPVFADGELVDRGSIIRDGNARFVEPKTWKEFQPKIPPELAAAVAVPEAWAFIDEFESCL